MSFSLASRLASAGWRSPTRPTPSPLQEGCFSAWLAVSLRLPKTKHTRFSRGTRHQATLGLCRSKAILSSVKKRKGCPFPSLGVLLCYQGAAQPGSGPESQSPSWKQLLHISARGRFGLKVRLCFWDWAGKQFSPPSRWPGARFPPLGHGLHPHTYSKGSNWWWWWCKLVQPRWRTE